ncbi:hypothetical protein HAZT_HAZT002469 [Hyalella azteca]|uniref:Mutator-like transposase domain-containing protein n=1 Tax=Hyalella azteca TaxID=294128 RepID=A0A6A0HCK5_HYAAZ|nr:hypothetical protein HAZT_HAZT002469 [Hyalella azteca]
MPKRKRYNIGKGGYVRPRGGQREPPVERPAIVNPLACRQEILAIAPSMQDAGVSQVEKAGKMVLLPIDFVLVEKILSSKLNCSECDSVCDVTVNVIHAEASISTKCQACDAKQDLYKAEHAKKIDGSVSPFTLRNLTLIYYSLMNSDGLAGCKRICAALSTDGFSNEAFSGHCAFLFSEMEKFFAMKQNEMISALKRTSSENGTYQEGDEFLDLDVSFDGTWMTRGHKSHIGIGCVIELETGFVLDFEVLSNFCQECFKKEKALSPEEFAC